MFSPSETKLGRQVKIEKKWMLQKRRVLIGTPQGHYRMCQLPAGCKKKHLVMQPMSVRSQQIEIWQAGQDRRKLVAAKEKGP
jgi:hypothetical protein